MTGPAHEPDVVAVLDGGVEIGRTLARASRSALADTVQLFFWRRDGGRWSRAYTSLQAAKQGAALTGKPRRRARVA